MEEILGDIEHLNDQVDNNEIKSILSNMSFEDLQKLKERLGTKLYKEAYFGSKKTKQTNFKRKNKNKPREVSSKIKPKLEFKKSRLKGARDPRFDSLCGEFDKKLFEKRYEFINELKCKEKEELKEMLKDGKNEVQASKIKYLIQRLENQERERNRRKKELDNRDQERKNQIESLKSGKRPLFKSKFEKKVEDIVEKYQELKETGKLMKYIEKKQKRNQREYLKQV